MAAVTASEGPRSSAPRGSPTAAGWGLVSRFKLGFAFVLGAVACSGNTGESETGPEDAAGGIVDSGGLVGSDLDAGRPEGGAATGDAGTHPDATDASEVNDGEVQADATLPGLDAGDAGEARDASLAEASCNQCTSGQARCVYGAIAPCVPDDDGGTCWVWGSAAPCADPLKACRGTPGSASCECNNQCTQGATECVSDDIASCAQEGDGGACWYWGAAAPCADANQTCTTTGAVSSCTCVASSACAGASAATVCGNTTTVVTCAVDSNGCTYASSPSACLSPTPYCHLGGCTAEPPSCQAGGAGMSDCGLSGIDDCCAALPVSGGTFYRTYTNDDDAATGEADPASVSDFSLDKYPVTVGRFRQFVAAWNDGYLPPSGSGVQTQLNGGEGLDNAADYADAGDGGDGGDAGTYETGWDAVDWNAQVSPTDSNLGCSGSAFATWTSTQSGNEDLPINCINWYEAYAFCIWDGGFLPSEAQWAYAAAGGDEQLEYPWGSTAPGTANEYAIFGCNYPDEAGSATCSSVMNIAPVGTAASGAGAWGQLDLVGNLWGWAIDAFDSSYVDPCTDCADLPASATNRARRGADFEDGTSYLTTPRNRSSGIAADRAAITGVRCARAP